MYFSVLFTNYIDNAADYEILKFIYYNNCGYSLLNNYNLLEKCVSRIALGVLFGLMVWGVFLLASDFAWEAFSPDWFGKSQNELRSAILYDTPFTPVNSILLLVVIRSAFYSIISGVLTAMVARDNDKATLYLGIFLLIFGTIVHSFFWNMVPFWYHFSILFLFIPLTMFGGKLITITPRRPRLVS